MSNEAECAAYFKSHPEWDRCFKLMRRKWESYGRTGGRVTLPQAKEAERKAIQKVLGKNMQPEKVCFSLQEFEAALQQTKFAPVSLKEVLDVYFGEEIRTNQEKTEQQREKKEQFFEQLQEEFQQKEKDYADILFWLQLVREQKKYGYSLLMTERHHSEEGAQALVRNVGEALKRVSREKTEEIPLAVLAAEVTGNPHYFDRGSTAGALLMNALCSLTACEYPQNAYDWRAALFQHNIVPDEVSNTVITYGLHLVTETGLHPAFEGFCRMQEPGVLTLSTLKNVKSVYGESDIVFVVENEMVFSHLVENLRGKAVTLLCTSGQPRTAAIKLLELFAREQVPIYYSGDIDPEGIKIADRIQGKFPKAVRIWRMGIQDYEKAISREEVSGRRLAMLEGVSCPELQETAQCIKMRKKAAYQENLFIDLLTDIEREVLANYERELHV